MTAMFKLKNLNPRQLKALMKTINACEPAMILAKGKTAKEFFAEIPSNQSDWISYLINCAWGAGVSEDLGIPRPSEWLKPYREILERYNAATEQTERMKDQEIEEVRNRYNALIAPITKKYDELSRPILDSRLEFRAKALEIENYTARVQIWNQANIYMREELDAIWDAERVELAPIRGAEYAEIDAINLKYRPVELAARETFGQSIKALFEFID